MTKSIPHYPDNSAAYPLPVKSITARHQGIIYEVDLGNIGICGSHGSGKTTFSA